MKTTEEKIAEAFANECAQTSHEHTFARGYYAALRSQQPSDPKHLPPRDCLVDIDGADCPFPRGVVTIHAVHRENDQEHGWYSAETGEPIDPSRVITWRELPEVE